MSHPEFTHHAEFITWAAEGHKDAMGYPFSSWNVARYEDDGRAMRDSHGRQIFEPQAAWLARYGHPINLPAKTAQMALFE